jgi:hypothetical protein
MWAAVIAKVSLNERSRWYDKEWSELFAINACDDPRNQARSQEQARAAYLGNHVFTYPPIERVAIRLHK